jgi:hypothetical protein
VEPKEYHMHYGPYKSVVRVTERSVNTHAWHEDEGRVAIVRGDRKGSQVHVSDMGPTERSSKSAGLRGSALALLASEIAMREHGVERFTGETHPAFARFLEKMGYGVRTSGGSSFVEKSLGEHRWPFGNDIEVRFKEDAPGKRFKKIRVKRGRPKRK